MKITESSKMKEFMDMLMKQIQTILDTPELSNTHNLFQQLQLLLDSVLTQHQSIIDNKIKKLEFANKKIKGLEVKVATLEQKQEELETQSLILRQTLLQKQSELQQHSERVNFYRNVIQTLLIEREQHMVEEVPGYSDSEDSISDFEGLDEYESDEETNVSSCIQEYEEVVTEDNEDNESNENQGIKKQSTM